MSLAKRSPAKSRMSIYISAENQRRLARIPKGEKTTLINDALTQALTAIEKRENFDRFLESVRSVKPVKMSASSEEMVRRLRETGSPVPSP